MSKLQLQRDKHPEDSDCRIFHSRELLTDQPMECGQAMQQVDNPVLQAVLQIRGVMMAGVTPYYIQVHKSPMYEWDEIEPKLLRLLGSFNTELPTRVAGPVHRERKPKGD